MATLLIDENLDGHGDLLAMRLGIDYWREMRDHFDIRFVHFEQVGIKRSAKDNAVWRICQENGLYLLTENRNKESDDSLEATIRREGTPQSLPVFTLSDAEQIYRSAPYRDEVIETQLEYFMDETNYRGMGRLYLP